MKKIKYALISVSDKKNIIYFARELLKRGISLISTSGTSCLLKKSGISVLELSNYTNFPEIMNGKVKTLHPKIYGGILADCKYDDNTIKKYNIIPIDMVIVNLYDFAKAIKSVENNMFNAVNNIDIGGSAMIRAAAKNHKNVTIIIDINDYDFIINQLDLYNNQIKFSTRFNLAIKAFKYTYMYDRMIFKFFNKKYNNQEKKNTLQFPNELNLKFIKKQDLRYGENSHQSAVFYIEKNLNEISIANSKQIQGKILSYNNIIDADIALESIKEFPNPTCVIVKHGNPCSIAMKNNLNLAYEYAYKGDPISAFGGIIALNRKIDELTALTIIKTQFVEIIIAPEVSKKALAIIATKPNIRLLIFGNFKNQCFSSLDFKRVRNGLLVQNYDFDLTNEKKLDIVTQRFPTQKEINDALFSWKVVKFVKSNAVVYSRDNVTISIGAGQMSRVYAIKLANLKAKDENKLMIGATIASDAFFPFRDSIDHIAQGVSCVIQPGGSIRDKEVIQAANERNMAMIFTHIRHFRH